MSAAVLRQGARDLVGFATERPGAALAAIVLGTIAMAALLAPLIAPQDPFDLASFDLLDAGLPPAWIEGSDPRFLLGTDAQGRDLLSAILYGTRISLVVGMLAVVIQAVLGIPLGLLAAYRGGKVDTIVTRAADIQLSLSTLMMAIIALALFRAGLGGEALSRYAVLLLVLVIGLAEWPYFARTARAATQVETAKDYVRAARALGLVVGHHELGADDLRRAPLGTHNRGNGKTPAGRREFCDARVDAVHVRSSGRSTSRRTPRSPTGSSIRGKDASAALSVADGGAVRMTSRARAGTAIGCPRRTLRPSAATGGRSANGFPACAASASESSRGDRSKAAPCSVSPISSAMSAKPTMAGISR